MHSKVKRMRKSINSTCTVIVLISLRSLYLLSDYKEYHTDTTVKFVVTLSAEKMQEAESVGFHKKFKMEGSLNTSNLVLFDHNGCLKKYSGVIEILKEFYDVRLDLYRKRKEWLVGQLEAEAAKLTNQARFIMEKIEGKVVIGKSCDRVISGIL